MTISSLLFVNYISWISYAIYTLITPAIISCEYFIILLLLLLIIIIIIIIIITYFIRLHQDSEKYILKMQCIIYY